MHHKTPSLITSLQQTTLYFTLYLTIFNGVLIDWSQWGPTWCTKSFMDFAKPRTVTNYLIKSFKEWILVLSAPGLPLSTCTLLIPSFIFLHRTLAPRGRARASSSCNTTSWACIAWCRHRRNCIIPWGRGKKARVREDIETSCSVVRAPRKAEAPE